VRYNLTTQESSRHSRRGKGASWISTDGALERREEDKALMDSEKMTMEEFIANALIESGCGQRCDEK